MKTLVTGSNGFIGKWLVSYLREKGDKIFEFNRQNGCDVLNKKNVENAFKKFNPDRIFHLAAQSNIPISFQKPKETLETNLIGTLNFLEVMKELRYKGVFVSMGSSSEYGTTTTDKPLSEDSPLHPNSPYALSKTTQYHLVRIYRKSYQLNLIHIRPFAIIGPGKQGDAVSDFAREIITIEKGKKKYLETGNLSHYRDFIDVRDFVRAIDLISSHARNNFIFNICSGKKYRLSKVVEILINLTKAKVIMKKDPKKMRPIDDKVIVGNPEKLQLLGFKPSYSINKTLSDILAYWRSTIKDVK